MIGAPRAHVRGHGARAVTFGSSTCSELSLLGMGLVTRSGLFTLFGVLGAFGACFAPAVLALYSRGGGTEIWRMLSALSVLQALWYVHSPLMSTINDI